MNQIDITPLCEAIIVLLGAIITAYVVPWVKEKTTAEEQKKIADWVEIAVYAAEKMYGAGMGQKKFEYAKAILEDHGIYLDMDTLIAVIDAEIRHMEQYDDVIEVETGVD